MLPLLTALAVLAWTLPLPLLLQLLLAVILPILVGLVTTRVTSSNAKALLLLLLAFVTSGITELLAAVTRNQPFDVGLWLITAVGTFATGVALHYGLFKPLGISAAAQSALRTAEPAAAAEGGLVIDQVNPDDIVAVDRAARRRAARQAKDPYGTP